MKIAFAGTPYFGALVLGALLRSGHEVALVITQPDRPAGRGRALRESPVKHLAAGMDLTVAQPERISDADFVDAMKSMGIEVLTVAAFGQILREPLLGGMPCINVHASLLPKYRGAAPIERAIMAGESVTGVSIMDITPKVDTGAVFLQRQVPIEDDDDAGSMYEKLGRTGGEALAEVLDAIESGGMKPAEQDESAATYVEKITAADMAIDWDRSAREVFNQIRGLSPRIGAFTTAGGHRLKIWKARVAEAAGPLPAGDPAGAAEPGAAMIDGERLLIACGAGMLELLEVQPEGKRRLGVAEFLRGYRPMIEDKRLGT